MTRIQIKITPKAALPTIQDKMTDSGSRSLLQVLNEKYVLPGGNSPINRNESSALETVNSLNKTIENVGD